MTINLSAPARINILGNPGDANEGDFATISTAIDLQAGATIERDSRLVFESVNHPDGDTALSLEYRVTDVPVPHDDGLELTKAAFNRLYSYSEELRVKLRESGFRIGTWTEVPPESGFGGSTLFVILALAALRELFELDRRKHNDYVLAELAQRVESEELGITCGFAERYVSLFGGIAYIDYRGKLHHQALGDEPFATYERLDRWVDTLPLVAVSSGVARNSGDVHGKMRPRYLREHAEWVDKRTEMPPMLRFMNAAWETAWRGKAALVTGDLPKIGALMNENHRIVDEMMTYCGLENGAGSVNNHLIRTALDNGALGAKLTGAGGGGSVFALTAPGHEDRIVEAWEQDIAKLGLAQAKAFKPLIEHDGLVVEKAT